MKVIVAGFTKTGTKSIHVALTELGYEVYDFSENFWYHGEEWKKILTSGGCIDDFKKMYKDVDVIVDSPTYRFWEEIHWAFPEAKIILMTRDEQSWFKSLQHQADMINKNKILTILMILTPTGRKYFTHMKTLFPIMFGSGGFSSPGKPIVLNEMINKRTFRQHNAYVMQNAPKDKLLVFNVKEGWEPLCEFLGKDVPGKPFPHENIGGVITETFLKEDPAIQRMKMEILVSLPILFGIGLFGSYKLYNYFSWKKCGILKMCFSEIFKST